MYLGATETDVWHRLAIPACGELRLEGYELETSLGCVVRFIGGRGEGQVVRWV